MKENKDLIRKYKEQNKEIDDRIDNAINIFGEKVTKDLKYKDLVKVLNPNNQYKMTSFRKYCMKYPNIPSELLFFQLELGKFLKCVNYNDEEVIVIKRPDTDFYIEPYLKSKDGYIYLKELDLVISEKAKDILDMYVEELGEEVL